MKRISTFSLIALVISCQLGVGVFMLPAYFARHASIGLFGWVIAGSVAMCLALIFAKLFTLFPDRAGVHVYVEAAFGRQCAFLIGWSYWIISVISNTALIVTAIGYLSSVFGSLSTFKVILLEFCMLMIVFLINLFGIGAAGIYGLFLVILKVIPLICIPILGLYLKFNYEHFIPFISDGENVWKVLQKTSFLAMWSFIGVEAITAPSISVQGSSKNVPKAIFWGTLSLVALYFINSVGVRAVVPVSVLADSAAPYSEAAKAIFVNAGRIDVIISFIAVIVCLNNLNAWTLSGGHLASNLADDGFFPSIFAKKNKYGAPYVSMFIASLLVFVFLVFCLQKRFIDQLELVIDVSVIIFLLVYAMCAVSLCLILAKKNRKISCRYAFMGLYVVVFSIFGICSNDIKTVIFAILAFLFSSAPLYIYLYLQRRKQGAR
ncbi:APC family permease [Candidatus Sneabacter namystus]|uniref:Amino acid permease n=1 Tax=Candidatus Sneabacter namystus TaxID=2601646 RepID=A0A5C0UI86_9RICK|nr:amino acid permease [Candidatus Sneabacter namystus]QEK39796.1 amino acid permease [Candidatus Sneabacter namystus]